MTWHKNTRRRRVYRRRGLCWICLWPNSEMGQRGPRLAHQACRQRLDAGEPVAAIRAWQAEQWAAVGGA